MAGGRYTAAGPTPVTSRGWGWPSGSCAGTRCGSRGRWSGDNTISVIIILYPVIRDRVSLVAGHFSGDWFELEPEPRTEYGKEEWAEHKRSMGVEWERRRRSKQLGMLPSHQEKQNVAP